jgi:hypothetical protein
MGGKSQPAPPPSPDPYAVSRAQTGSNVSTSIANAVMGNAWETSPLGRVRYEQRGNYTMSEPVLGRDGQPTTTRRWVADPNQPGTPNDTQYRQYREGSGARTYDSGAENTGNVTQAGTAGGYFDSRTGQPWQDYAGGAEPGGRWVEETAMSTRELPIWERITELSPEQQRLYEGQTQAQQGLLNLANQQIPVLQQTLGTPFNYDGIAEAPTNNEAYRAQVERALFERMNPQLDRDRASLETQLTNQGFTRGTEAFRQEQDSFGRQVNDARTQVFLASGQEASRQLAEQLGLRERAIQERAALRSAPINEISALLGQSQVQMPQFSPFRPGEVAPTDVSGNVYRSADIDQRNYQQQMQMRQASMSGMYGLGASLLGGLGKAAMMGSDIRIKENISRVGTLDNGLPVYAFRYKSGGPMQIGLMAQDVEQVNPAAVAEFDGVKHVDYGMAVQ